MFTREVDRLVHLTINNEEITTTFDHPFYVKGKGFINATNLWIGAELVNKDGCTIVVENIFKEYLEGQTTKVYNFKVDDYHTYFVGNNYIWVHNAECVVHPNGEVEVTDWEGYPENGPKPDGKLRLIDGDEYQQARTAANNENAAIHRNNPALKGKDIHEVHPVKFGGSPTDHANKIPLSRAEHAKYTRFWNEIQRQAESQM